MSGAGFKGNKERDLYQKHSFYFCHPEKNPPSRRPKGTEKQGVENATVSREVPENTRRTQNTNTTTTTVSPDGPSRERITVNGNNNAVHNGEEQSASPLTAEDKPVAATTQKTSTTTKHSRATVQSNSKAKRQQPRKAFIPNTHVYSTTGKHTSQASSKARKKFGWAADLENSQGTGIRKSDARIIVKDDTESDCGHRTGTQKSNPNMIVLDDIESFVVFSDSDDSMIDATPPVAGSKYKKSLSVNLKPSQPLVTDLDFGDIWSDTSPTAFSAIDIDVRPMPGNQTDRFRESSDFRKQISSRADSRGILKTPPRIRQPHASQAGKKKNNAEGVHNCAQQKSTNEDPELSFTTADLRSLKRSGHRPEFVRAVDRGDSGIPLLEKRQSISKSTRAPASVQDSEVGHAIQDAKSNARRNSGPLLGNSSHTGAQGIRIDSLDIVHRKAATSGSALSVEARSRYASNPHKPLFAFRPRNREDDRVMRGPLFAIGTQRDLKKIRESLSKRINRHTSSSRHMDTNRDGTENRLGRQGIPNLGHSSYERPTVSEADERLVTGCSPICGVYIDC